MRFGLALLLAAGPALAAPVPKDFKKSDDQALIVGTWVGIGTDTVRFKFAADGTLETWYGPNPAGSHMKWTWRITDPKATPRVARITRAESATAWYDCVYDLTGDTMRFALVLTNGAKLPERVEPLGGLEFHSLTREKDGK